MTPAEALEELNKRGPWATLGDVGGQGARDLSETFAQVPGKARTAATKVFKVRAAARGRRLREGIKQVLSSEDLDTTVAQIAKARNAEALPHLETALTHGTVKSPTVVNLVTRQKLLKKFVKQAQGDLSLGPVKPTDMRLVHQAYVKLNERIRSLEAARTPAAKEIRELLKLRSMKSRFRTALVKEIPEYGQYLEKYASGASLKSAAELGSTFEKFNARGIRNWMKDASQQEQEMFVIGAARALKDKVSKTINTGGSPKALFGSDELRSRMRALFPNNSEGQKQFREFRKLIVEQETPFIELERQAMGGSPTARRLAQQQQTRMPDWVAAAGAEAAMPGAAIPTLISRAGLRAFLKRFRGAPTKRQGEMIADVLYTTSGEINRKMLGRLISSAKDQTDIRAILAAVSAAAGSFGGQQRTSLPLGLPLRPAP